MISKVELFKWTQNIIKGIISVEKELEHIPGLKYIKFTSIIDQNYGKLKTKIECHSLLQTNILYI